MGAARRQQASVLLYPEAGPERTLHVASQLTKELLAAVRSFYAHQITFPLIITSCGEVFPDNVTAGANVFTHCREEAGETDIRDGCRGKKTACKKL